MWWRAYLETAVRVRKQRSSEWASYSSQWSSLLTSNTFSLMILLYLLQGPNFVATSKSAVNTNSILGGKYENHSVQELSCQVSKLEPETSVTDVLSLYSFSPGVRESGNIYELLPEKWKLENGKKAFRHCAMFIFLLEHVTSSKDIKCKLVFAG